MSYHDSNGEEDAGAAGCLGIAPAPAQLPKLSGPLAWVGSDFGSSCVYTWLLDEKDIGDITSALDNFNGTRCSARLCMVG